LDILGFSYYFFYRMSKSLFLLSVLAILLLVIGQSVDASTPVASKPKKAVAKKPLPVKKPVPAKPIAKKPVPAKPSSKPAPKPIVKPTPKPVTPSGDAPILAECFPHGSTGPIDAVYLHGLWKPLGTPDANGFRNLERINRKVLNDLAVANNVRIALPVGTVKAGWTEWNGVSLADIEKRAIAACGGAPLAQKRALIGFSNGAQASGKLCNEATGYEKVLVLGPPGKVPACPRAVIEIPHHVFPYPIVTSTIQGLRK
jgi:hypothetical protein